MLRFFIIALLFGCLAACDSREPNQLSLKEYEGPEGEAVIRHLLKSLPPVEPTVPKVYTVVKGPHLESTRMAFVKRLEDLKLTFVSGEVLTLRDPERSIVDPRSGLAPVTLQIADMRRSGGDTWEVQAGWAYKKVFERRRLKLKKQAEGFAVIQDERIEGNYSPAP